ncbi:HWE histidine kinase domain-containing protein [Falsiroseomonas sp.]|uniref:HWE histidine kinase domain-containing protein n=1 Tax=Falsiroseomonas sp. TaxID=2870721 RepID=UPI0035685F04
MPESRDDLPDGGGLPAADALRRRLAELEAENARLARALEAAGGPAEAALRESEARLRLAQEAGGICSWEWDVETGVLHWSDSCHALHGTDPSVPPSQEAWMSGIHPLDRGAMAAAIREAIEGRLDTWDTEFRFTRFDDGATRWLVGRGRVVRDAATGMAVRLRGIGLDITERKAAEERQALLMLEVDHRARNVLAVVQSALRLTPRGDAEQYARAVEGRIAALARAHAMLADARWQGSELGALLTGELSAFLATQRVELAGPPVMLPARTAQPLAMAAHELATNAVKHGALSSAEGSVTVTWALEQADSDQPVLALRWAEAGGPPVTPPQRRGFGSRVLEGVLRQAGGRVMLDWAPEGLVCRLQVPLGSPADSTAGTKR